MSDTEIAPPEETQPPQPAEPDGPSGRVRGRGVLLGLLGAVAVVTGAAQVFGGTAVALGAGGTAAVAGGGYAYYRHRKNAAGKKRQRTWTLKWDRRQKTGGQHRRMLGGSGRSRGRIFGGSSGSRGRPAGPGGRGRLFGSGRGRSGSGRSGTGSASRGRWRPFGRGRSGSATGSSGSGRSGRWRNPFRGRPGSGSSGSGSASRRSRFGSWLRHPFSRSRRAAAAGGRSGPGSGGSGPKTGGRAPWWRRTGRRLRHPFARGGQAPGAGGGKSRPAPPARRVNWARRAWWRLTPNAAWRNRRPGAGKIVPAAPRPAGQPSPASRVAKRMVPAWIRNRWNNRKHHPITAVRGWWARLRQRGQQDTPAGDSPQPDPPDTQPQPDTEPVIARGPGLAPVIQMDDHRRQQEAVPTGGTEMGNPAEQLDELADEISNYMPGSGDELDAFMKAWPEALRKFGGAITSMADGWGEEHIHPAVIDSMKEHGGAVAGVGDSAEDANETHAREHHLWLAD